MKILKILYRARRPLTHADVTRRLGGKADRVTIYRVLDALVGAELVHRAWSGGRTWLFETADNCTARACHPHFTCRQCDKTTCLLDVKTPLARGLSGGYVAERQRVHIEGLCPQCAGNGDQNGIDF